MSELELRREIVATALAMNERGINRGKSGNVSARIEAGFLITPSGLAYESLRRFQFDLETTGSEASRADRCFLRPNGAFTAISTLRVTMPARSCTRIPRSRPRSPASVATFRHSIT